MMKDLLPKLGRGVAQTVLAGLAIWAAGKVGFGPALAGWSVAQAALAKALDETTVGGAVALGAPGAAAGGGMFFVG